MFFIRGQNGSLTYAKLYISNGFHNRNDFHAVTLPHIFDILSNELPAKESLHNDDNNLFLNYLSERRNFERTRQVH